MLESMATSDAARQQSDPSDHVQVNNDFDELKLRATQTNQTISGMTISPELFEKLFLTPKVPHKGDAYKRFANPTPMVLSSSKFMSACAWHADEP